MQFPWTLLAGIVIGIIAMMLTPGRDPQGFLAYHAVRGKN